jgi:hypothetical protein
MTLGGRGVSANAGVLEPFNQETAVKANLQVEMRIEMGRGVVPAKAGAHLRCCSNLINGFTPTRE